MSNATGLHDSSARARGEPGGAAPGEAQARPAIDLVHLTRQTLGDKDLEVELLGLFARQARTILANLTSSAAEQGRPSSAWCDPLHTLCGSARAVGAWGVAAEAQCLEQSFRSSPDRLVPSRPDGLAALRTRVLQACAVIDDLLQDEN